MEFKTFIISDGERNNGAKNEYICISIVIMKAFVLCMQYASLSMYQRNSMKNPMEIHNK